MHLEALVRLPFRLMPTVNAPFTGVILRHFVKTLLFALWLFVGISVYGITPSQPTTERWYSSQTPLGWNQPNPQPGDFGTWRWSPSGSVALILEKQLSNYSVNPPTSGRFQYTSQLIGGEGSPLSKTFIFSVVVAEGNLASAYGRWSRNGVTYALQGSEFSGGNVAAINGKYLLTKVYCPTSSTPGGGGFGGTATYAVKFYKNLQLIATGTGNVSFASSYESIEVDRIDSEFLVSSADNLQENQIFSHVGHAGAFLLQRCNMPMPGDGDWNLLKDTWETKYYGGAESGSVPVRFSQDQDGDGYSAWDEQSLFVDGTGTSPFSDMVADIALESGGGQSYNYGSPLANPIVLRVTDSQGRPNPDAPVLITFRWWWKNPNTGARSVIDHPAHVEQGYLHAGSDGKIVFTPDPADLPPAFGVANYDWTAVVSDVIPVPAPLGGGGTVSFKLSVRPAKVSVVSGSGQPHSYQKSPASPLIARVTDLNGNPVSNAPVMWSVSEASGYTPVYASPGNGSGEAQWLPSGDLFPAVSGQSHYVRAQLWDFWKDEWVSLITPDKSATFELNARALEIGPPFGGGQTIGFTANPSTIGVYVTEVGASFIGGPVVVFTFKDGTQTLGTLKVQAGADGRAILDPKYWRSFAGRSINLTAAVELAPSQATQLVCNVRPIQVERLSGSDGQVIYPWESSVTNPFKIKVKASPEEGGAPLVNWPVDVFSSGVNGPVAQLLTDANGVAVSPVNLQQWLPNPRPAGGDVVFEFRAAAPIGNNPLYSAFFNLRFKKILVEKISGDEQRVELGLPPRDPLVIRLLDEEGKPVAGNTVKLAEVALDADLGQVTGTTSLSTDSAGYVKFFLPALPGSQAAARYYVYLESSKTDGVSFQLTQDFQSETFFSANPALRQWFRADSGVDLTAGRWYDAKDRSKYLAPTQGVLAFGNSNLPSIRLDSRLDLGTTGFSNTSSSAQTVFIALKRDAGVSPAANSVILGGKRGNNIDVPLIRQESSAPEWTIGADSYDSSIGSRFYIPTSQPQVLSFVVNTGSSPTTQDFYLNSQWVARRKTSSSFFSDSNWRPYLGAMPAEAYEVIIFDGSLTATLCRDIENYLAKKYGGAMTGDSLIPQIVGLKAWFRADQGVTVESDGKVSAWANSAPGFESNPATQATLALRPTFVLEGIGGHPAIHFDEQRLMTDILPMGAVGSISVYGVITLEKTGVNDILDYQRQTSPYRSFAVRANSTTTNLALVRTTSTSTQTIFPAGPAFSQNIPQLFGLRNTASTNVEYWLNGVSEIEPTSLALSTLADHKLAIGDMANGAGASMKGKVSELVIFNRKLTDAEHQTVLLELSKKYKIFGESSSVADSDTDNLPDFWELSHFGTLSNGPDNDGDGFTNLVEYQQGTNPKDYFNGVLPELHVVTGDTLVSPPGGSVSLGFKVVDKRTGTALPALQKAPLVLEVLGGDSGFTASNPKVKRQSIVANATGDATATLYLSASPYQRTIVRASITVDSQTVEKFIIVSPTLANAPPTATGDLHPEARIGRISMVAREDVFVSPLDPLYGVELPGTGELAVTAQVPSPSTLWFSRREDRASVNVPQSDGVTSTVVRNNPLVAFGSSCAGTPMYVNQPYKIAVYAGQFFPITAAGPDDFVITVYDRTQPGTLPVVATKHINIPRPDVPNGGAYYNRTIPSWNQFANSDFCLEETVSVGTTPVLRIKFRMVAAFEGDESQNWGVLDGGTPIIIEQTVLSDSYGFVVSAHGKPGGISYTKASDPNLGADAPLPLYCFDATIRPAWQATIQKTPHFAGAPLPPEYIGKTLTEIQETQAQRPPYSSEIHVRKEEISGATSTDVTTPANSADVAWLTTLNHSPELRSNAVLDRFLTDLGILDSNGNPTGSSEAVWTIVDFVMNEIQLTDALEFPEVRMNSASGGPLNGWNVGTAEIASKQSINSGSISRDALAAFIERQGSPTEQCVLLTYLLRKAGIPAVYMFAPVDGLKMLDSEMSRLLGVQLQGAIDPYGDPVTTGNSSIASLNDPARIHNVISVNYPWVAVYEGGKWNHVFPWLKDNAIVEGRDLYACLPEKYNSGYKLAEAYIRGDREILQEDLHNVPRILFPKFLERQLRLTNPEIGLSDIGVTITNRPHHRKGWSKFPQPFKIEGIPTAYPSLSDVLVRRVSADLQTTTYEAPFDTVKLRLYSKARPEIGIETSELYAFDLHNRRLVVEQLPDGSGNWNVNLSLEAFSSTATAGDFSTPAALQGAQQKSFAINAADGDLLLVITYQRAKSIDLAYQLGGELFGGGLTEQRREQTCTLEKGEYAAVCFNFGKVTSLMLDLRAQNFWRKQAAARAAGSPDFESEVAYGDITWLLGMSYYERMGVWSDWCEQIHKQNLMSRFSVGLASYKPEKDANNEPVIKDGKPSYAYPVVDMFSDYSNYLGNGTIHAENAIDGKSGSRDFVATFVVGQSAEEHEVVSTFLGDKQAVSTVRLLQMAERAKNLLQSGDGIVELNSTNYQAQGETLYDGVRLKEWYGWTSANNGTGSLWNRIASSFSSGSATNLDPAHAKVFLTPGYISNPSGSFNGVGALLLNPSGAFALISSSYVANGGYGSKFSSIFESVGNAWQSVAKSASGMTLVKNQTSYSYEVRGSASGSAGIDLGGFKKYESNWNVLDFTAQLSAITSLDSGAYFDDTWRGGMAKFGATFNVEESLQNQIQSSFQLSSGAKAAAFVSSIQPLKFQLAYHLDPTYMVGDPVNVVTGGFYIDVVDLELPGPLPIQLRRNYSSLETANGQFGFGWSSSIAPHMNVFKKDGATKILTAELDGTTVVYSYWQTLANGSVEYIPRLEDNPFWHNRNGGAAGGVGNLRNNRMVRAANGQGDLVLGESYQIFGSDGSVRTFKVKQFPITDRVKETVEGVTTEKIITINRLRPYLVTWADSRGNFLAFNFYGDNPGDDPLAHDYGQLLSIQSSSGQRMVFSYDVNGHIVAARTKDGRKVSYDYDKYGDLVGIQRPDGSWEKFEYEHSVHKILRPVDDISVNPTTNEITTSSPHELRVGDRVQFETTGTLPAGLAAGIDYFVSIVSSPTAVKISAVLGGAVVDITGAGTGTINVDSGETAPYSKHLILQERKPEGRTIVNVYDSYGRVVEQWAPVGDDARLVKNAEYSYRNLDGSPLIPQPNVAPSGRTVIADAYSRKAAFEYTEGRITKATDRLGHSIITEWYLTDYEPDGYARSVKSIQDSRGLLTTFKYANGNLREKVITGDLDGVAGTVETIAESAVFNSRNLPESTLSANNIRTTYEYGAGRQSYLVTSKRLDKLGVQLSKDDFHYRDFGTVHAVPGGPAFAANLPDWQRLNSGVANEKYSETVYDTSGYLIKETAYPLSPNYGGGFGGPEESDRPMVTEFIRNLRGEVDEQINPNGTRTFFAYDNMGRVIWEEVWELPGSGLLSQKFIYYNLNGEVNWIDGPAFGPEDYIHRRYDFAGRLSEEVRWRSRAKATSHSAAAGAAGVEAETGANLYSSTFYRYDLNGNLRKVVSPSGDWKEMEYDAEGHVLRAKSFFGQTGECVSEERFEYEPGGNVAKHVSPLGGVTETKYNSKGQPREVTNPDGSRVTMEYSAQTGLISRESLPGVTLVENAVRKYTRDDVARTLSVSGGGPAYTQWFDAFGRQIMLGKGGIHTTSYDALDRIRSYGGPPGFSNLSQKQAVTYRYDQNGRSKSTEDAVGNVIITKVDGLGRVIQILKPVPNPPALAYIQAETFEYDRGGYSVTKYDDQAGVITQTWTDTFGAPVVVAARHRSDPAQFHCTVNTYDVGGRLVQTEEPSLVGPSENQTYRKTTFGYGPHGAKAWEKLPDGAVTSYLYDAVGNLTRRMMPGNLTWNAEYDSAGRQKKEYLTNGASVTQVRQREFYAETNAIGLVKEEIDPRGQLHQFSYDTYRRPAEVTVLGSAGKLSRLFTYHFYLGLVTDIQDTKYDVNGGVISSIMLQHTFDNYGQIVYEKVIELGTVLSNFIQQWDAAGRRIMLKADLANQGVGAGLEQLFSYRNDGKLLGITVPNAVVPTVDGGKLISYEYGNEQNGMVKKRNASWKTVDISRNGLGQVQSVQTKWNGVLALSETPSWLADSRMGGFAYSKYNTSGALIAQDSLTYEFDERNRLKKEPFKNADNLSQRNFLYEWDDNLPAKLGVRTNAVYQDSPIDSTGEAFDFAGANGLAGHPEKSDLDAFSRPLKETYAGDFVSRFGGTPQSTTTSAGVKYTQTTSNVYDADGNVTQRILKDTPTEKRIQYLTWNELGQLAKVEYRANFTAANWANGNGFDWTATYDPLGRRIKTTYRSATFNSTGVKTLGAAQTTTSHFDPEVEFLEVGFQLGTFDRFWKVYGPDKVGGRGTLQGIGGLEAFINERTGSGAGVLSDYSGNVAGWVPFGGALAWNPTRFSAWGILPVSLPSAYVFPTSTSFETAPWLHTNWQGRRLDPMGFYWMGARYYEPTGGRFISPDPAGHEGSMDLYSYANGDPVNNVDPDGRLSIGWKEMTDVGSSLPSETLARVSTNSLLSAGKPVNIADAHAQIADLSSRYEVAAWNQLMGYQNGAEADALYERMDSLDLFIAREEKRIAAGRPEPAGLNRIFTSVFANDAALVDDFKVFQKNTRREYPNLAMVSDVLEFGFSLPGVGVPIGAVQKAPNPNVTDYRATFFKANPGLEGTVWVHHAVEQKTLTRFPGVMTESQMHALDNLRGIPNEINSKIHLSEIRKNWNEFYRKNPAPTAQQLQEHATKIDDKYGHLFNPPIR